jgi:quercetin dioxygenase-like cupin family protein
MNMLPFGVVALASGFCIASPGPGRAQRPHTGITHTPLLQRLVPGTANREVIVWVTEYAPGTKNPRHEHPAAITFYVLSGTGIWQEDGNPPVTLHAGESLFCPPGTIHAHWNPSTTEKLRFLEFIAAEKGKGGSIHLPQN